MTIALFQFQQLDYALDIYANERLVARLGLDASSDSFLLEYARSWILADGTLSSTHILKPEPLNAALPHMVANEHFCMRLAARMSVKRYKNSHVAAVEILRVPSPVLSIKRFDRAPWLQTQSVPLLGQHGAPTGKHLDMDLMQRLHIIDGCQASDLSVAAKYERNFGNGADVRHIRDGASFKRIFAIRQHLETPVVGIQRLVLWAVTTLLFGNSDAHGKNISFHVGRAGLNVAELYDLVSVVQYDASKLEHSLAMAFGDAFELEEVKSFALADFCMHCGISRSFFARELETLCNIALEQSPLQEQDPAYRGPEHEFVKLISALVSQRAFALKAMAKEIPSYKSELF